MTVICAWCEQEGRVKLIGEMGLNDRHNMISHGICEDHEKAMLKKIENLRLLARLQQTGSEAVLEVRRHPLAEVLVCIAD